MSKVSQCDNYPWGMEDHIHTNDRCSKRKHPIIIEADIEKLESEIQGVDNRVTEVNNKLDYNLELKQDKLTEGNGITISDDNTISATHKLTRKLQSEIDLGGISSVDNFNKDKSVEDVLEKLLSDKHDLTLLYVGATDKPAETVAELQPEEISAEVLTSKKIERNIISKYVPTTEEGQYPTIAVDRNIKLADWKNKATGISYMDDVEHIKTNKHNIYRFKHSVYNEEEGGEEEVFTFTKESN